MGRHDLIGTERFNGWNHQRHDEPVLQLIHERRKRLARHVGDSDSGWGWGWDFSRHVGGSLGNFATYASAGGELRFGYHLPDDLATALLRPVGENTRRYVRFPIDVGTGICSSRSMRAGCRTTSRWTATPCKSSHRMDKKESVASIGFGVALCRGHWRLAFARYQRTREFEGQGETPAYGTITSGLRF